MSPVILTPLTSSLLSSPATGDRHDAEGALRLPETSLWRQVRCPTPPSPQWPHNTKINLMWLTLLLLCSVHVSMNQMCCDNLRLTVICSVTLIEKRRTFNRLKRWAILCHYYISVPLTFHGRVNVWFYKDVQRVWFFRFIFKILFLTHTQRSIAYFSVGRAHLLLDYREGWGGIGKNLQVGLDLVCDTTTWATASQGRAKFRI